MRKVPPGVPPNMALSLFGITGCTAYFGITDIGQVKSGDTVVVSGAAGSTGSIAGQSRRDQKLSRDRNSRRQREMRLANASGKL